MSRSSLCHRLLLLLTFLLLASWASAQAPEPEEEDQFCGWNVYLNLTEPEEFFANNPDQDPEKSCLVFSVPQFDPFEIDWGVTHYKVGVGLSHFSSTFSDRFGSATLEGQGRRWPFALVYHESGALVQLGFADRDLTGADDGRSIAYQARGLEFGVGWNVPLAPRLEVNPMLTVFTGKGIAQVEVGPRKRPGDVTVYGLEVPLHWDVGAWWGNRNLFVGPRLGVYSGGTQDADIQAVFQTQSSYGLEFGGTFK